MESLTYTPREAILDSLPETRGNKLENLLANLAPDKLPTELDQAISLAMIDNMTRIKY